MRRAAALSPTELAALYASSEYYSLGERHGIGYADYYGDERMYRTYFRHKLRRLRSVLPPGKLVEVGAAAGFALVEARRIAWTVEGIEMSPHAACFAHERFALDVRIGTFDDLTPSGDADVVAAFQTIEHVTDVRSALRSMHAALRPRGALVLTTPDHDSRQRKFMGRFWPSYRPEHLTYLDRRSVHRFLFEEGFRVRSVRNDDPLLVPVSRLLERASHYWARIRIDGRALSALYVPVWLGDMEIVAERM